MSQMHQEESPRKKGISKNISLDTVSGPQPEETYLDHGLQEQVLEIEHAILCMGGSGEPLIRLMNQVLNGNPDAHFIFGCMRSRGVAIDHRPEEAQRHFSYAARMGVAVPKHYLSPAEGSEAA